MRVVGFLDAVSGRVQAWDFNRVTASRLGQCWLRAAQSYPQAKTIYLVIDSWPVHFHFREHVLAQLQSFVHGSQSLLRYVGLFSQ